MLLPWNADNLQLQGLHRPLNCAWGMGARLEISGAGILLQECLIRVDVRFKVLRFRVWGFGFRVWESSCSFKG